MVIRVSTLLESSNIPSLAVFILVFPSKAKGLVTIAIVRDPDFLAISAIIGAAPVPVPRPSPAAIKTKSAPTIRFFNSSRFCSAALRATSGLEPAPLRLVTFSPSKILIGA